MQDYSPSLQFWTGVLFAMTPAMLMTGYLLSMLQGVGRFATFNLLRMTQTVVYFAGIVGLGVSGTLTPEHVAVVFITTHGLAAVAVSWTCRGADLSAGAGPHHAAGIPVFLRGATHSASGSVS